MAQQKLVYTPPQSESDEMYRLSQMSGPPGTPPLPANQEGIEEWSDQVAAHYAAHPPEDVPMDLQSSRVLSNKDA